jgi:hypothetical protein
VSKATYEQETPIFVELNKELGELPEIVIHDFAAHGFEFGSAAPSADVEEKAEAAAEEVPANARGRRRRKES